jgi:hypothetical protein
LNSLSRKLLPLSVALFTLLALAASPALANGGYGGGDRYDYNGHYGHNDGRNRDRAVQCNGTFTGVTIRSDVVVPPNKSCTLINSTVKGGVEVQKNAFFQASNTTITEDVEGDQALTVFINQGSRVGGNVVTNRTAQVFVFDSTVGGGIGVAYSTDRVNICGNTVNGAGIGVVRSGRDIIVGDPLTVDCAGNSVPRGSVLIAQNNTDVELVVRGNSIPNGNLYVLDNKGPSDKFVQSNTGGKTIKCTGNDAPFVGAPNPGWQNYQGQCPA